MVGPVSTATPTTEEPPVLELDALLSEEDPAIAPALEALLLSFLLRFALRLALYDS
jgi:hypothetical protein